MNPRDAIKKDDALWSWYFCGQVANLFARVSVKTKLTPNFYSTLSFLCGITAAIFFFFGNVYGNLIYAIIFLNFALIFDCTDGQLARLKGMTSKFGAWYDYHSDKIKDGIILLSIAFGIYFATHDYLVFIIAFATIFFQFLRNITRLNRVNFQLETKGEVQDKKAVADEKVKSQFMRSFRNSLMFKEADRYLLFTVFALLNQLYIGLVLYMLIELFFAASSGYINYKEFAKYDREHKS
ncbi:MAG: CDP-alcohol phosphatidyltransferase family protein [Patescibacteria group bacterium]